MNKQNSGATTGEVEYSVGREIISLFARRRYTQVQYTITKEVELQLPRQLRIGVNQVTVFEKLYANRRLISQFSAVHFRHMEITEEQLPFVQARMLAASGDLNNGRSAFREIAGLIKLPISVLQPPGQINGSELNRIEVKRVERR